MEAVVLIGLQGAGKSTFYRDRFFATHVRINLDMLKTRHREWRLLQTYLETRQPGGHFISAEDVAGMMLFLCGPESRDITGAALPIDGGWSVH